MVKALIAFEGGKVMANQQKDRIITLRGRGKGYGSIACEVGVSEGTVKSFCRRNNLTPVCLDGQSLPAVDICGYCGLPLTQSPGTKKKRFCSDECRLNWWHAHPEAMAQRAIYHFMCGYCDAVFESYGNANRKYCSLACASAARRCRHD